MADTLLGNGGTESTTAAAPAANAAAATDATATAPAASTTAAPATETNTAAAGSEVKTETTTAAKVEDGTTKPATDGTEAAAGGEQKPKDETDKPNPLLGAPEGEYEAFAAPEGKTFNESVAKAIPSLAKELGLSQAGAQKLAEESHKIVEAIQTGQADIVKQASTEWIEQAKKDPEIGNANQATFDKNMAHVAKARDVFVNPELKTVFDQSGLGNHPEMIRLMMKIGKAMTEDSMVTADPGSRTSKISLAERLYPTSTKPQPTA